MSYYRRPMGDYKTYGYAGDPGWLSSVWKGIKKVALPIIGGMLGGPVGASLGTAVSASKPSFPGIKVTNYQPGAFAGQVGFPGGTSISAGFMPMQPGQGRLPPFTATGAGVLPAGGRTGLGVPSGWHFAKDGSGRLVRNRRMNVANPRALRRSMRRVQGFEKLARRTISFTRRVKMKKRRSS